MVKENIRKNISVLSKEQLAKKLLDMEKKLERKEMKIINKHELDGDSWTCKWCKRDHPAFDDPCVDRYEDGVLVKDVK